MHKQEHCHTKYPFVMIHGAGFRDRKYLNYWGRIPKVLRAHGCQIYYGNQDSWASVEDNAAIIKSSIEDILKEHQATKVNIIAHSKGGLESRYIISSLGMAEQIASLTTIATPHHGSKTMDMVCGLPTALFRMVSVFANLWFRLLGDKQPDFHHVCKQFTTKVSEQFNQDNPDMPGVYYQSYAAVMKHSFSDVFMWIPHAVVQLVEGPSDGLVTPASATWTNFKGILKSATGRGISHADEVDIRRMRLSKRRSETGVTDICDVYLKIVSDLKEKGF